MVVVIARSRIGSKSNRYQPFRQRTAVEVTFVRNMLAGS
jgi:hypothetical protein